ncbi:MAG: UDP-N-acetylmuramoyl-L-alanyl-D-glutamate--2,6-diaminopimelate ligase [Chloroflexia bacterium]|nr:UDP-N-acetylmuramoyl-L-alanyl-D-glutamate--2,6-diaminopimelate ligase [Chloroflexia bacterium]
MGQLTRDITDVRIVGDRDVTVSGIQYDSRLVRPGDLFAALRGGDHDGHRFIPAAIANGASAILVEHDAKVTGPQLITGDSRAVLAQCAAAFYGHPSRELTTIGITGTDGKTTTSHLIDHVLRRTGHVTGMIGTIGITIGSTRSDELPHQTTPESNLVQGYLRESVEAGCDTAIIEATSHGLATHRLDGVEFDIAGVTNITREHLEFHGTIERYRAAKAILLHRVAANSGVVVLNADDSGAMAVLSSATGADVVRYSVTGRDASIVASNVDVRIDGTAFDVVVDGTSFPVRLPLIGEFNVANALCAIGVSRAAGASLNDIVVALESAGGVSGRLNRIDEGQPFSVIVDYAHTPESLHKVLSLLRDVRAGGRLIVVSGSAGERDPGKRPLQGAVCSRLADISIFTNEDPRHEDAGQIISEIEAGARAAGGIVGESVFPIVDRREAIAHAMSLAAPGDTVLLAGKGHERSIIIGDDHVPWDEAAVARAALEALGFAAGERRVKRRTDGADHRCGRSSLPCWHSA